MSRLKISENKVIYKITKNDKIIISLILLFSAGFIIRNCINEQFILNHHKVALVYHKNCLIEKLSLENDRVILLSTRNEITVEIKQGKIRILRSNCPQQVCVNRGWIQDKGQIIVCVPNDIFIEIESANLPIVDAVCY